MKIKPLLYFLKAGNELTKILRIMRLITIMMIIGIFQVNASVYSQNEVFSFKESGLTMRSVLKTIESRSKFKFFLNDDLTNVDKKIDLIGNNMKIDQVLDVVLAGTNLSYKILENNLVVISPSVLLQQRKVSGKVTNGVTGEPLVGVTVFVEGTKIGVITDFNGNFSINVPKPNSILTFSFIGYNTEKISLNGQSTLDVKLKPNITKLDEVVVVGYGSVKKSDLTGSVSIVNSSKLSQVPVTTLSQAIQGRVPGVLITNSNWSPGATPSVMVRGKRSISASSNDPLYVVDGIPMTGGMSEISPSDIESMNVLKDASATAIYGARGSNGVIIITTKKGKSGATQVDYNVYTGVQTILHQLPYMNGAEFAERVRESYRSTGVYTSAVPNWALDQTIGTFKNDAYTLASLQMAYDANGNYDPSKVRSGSEWWKAVQRTGIITDHQLSIRGGDDKTTFLISGTYNKNKGVIKNEDYERYSIRLNIDHQLSRAIKVGGQTLFSHSLQNRGSGLMSNWRVMPLGRFTDDNGNLLLRVSGTDDQYWNPLNDLADGAISRPLKTNRYFGSYYAEIKLPIEGLKFRSNLGLDFLSTQNYEFYGSNTVSRKGGTNYANNATSEQLMYTLENLLFYDKTINDHTLGFTLLQSIQQNVQESNGIPVENIPSDALLYNNVGSALIPGTLSSNRQQWNLASFMGRANYSYKGRYLLTVSARYDGSSRLSEGNKWVLFPAAAFAWRVNDEAFLKSIPTISNLKFRLGYGTTASSEVNPYQTKGELSSIYYNYGTTNVIGYAPNLLPNKDLTWETTKQWNVGIDFGILKNRISGTVDYYLQNTFNVLLDRQLPVVSGFSTVKSNIGRTSNRGIEVSLTTVNIQSKDFSWTTDYMFYANKEKIVELYSGKQSDVGNGWFVGQPLNVFYDYKKVGIWQDTPEDKAEMAKFNANGSNFTVGSIKLYDNGDYKITEDDRVIQGQARPKFTASLINTFNYKNFDLSIFLYGSYGSMIKNNVDYLNQAFRNSGVKVDYWTPTNPTNAYPRPIAGVDYLNYYTTLQYQKADFLRVRSITFGYALPKEMGKRFGISRCRLYATVQNPLIWTNYQGVDPEGASGYATPSVSTWIIGLNLSF